MGTLVVLGSTGLVGQELLSAARKRTKLMQILAVTRSPISPSNENSQIRYLQFDFQNWDALEVQIKSFAGLDRDLHFFFCLGTTIKKAKSREAFRQVDYSYAVEFARVAQACGATSYNMVSAIGADPQSQIFYNRVKGEAERDIRAAFCGAIHILRPSLLLGSRREFRFVERMLILLSPIFSFLLIGALKNYRPIAAKAVAGVLLKAAFKETPENKTIIENSDIHAWWP